jgi:hypothetical protein
LNASPDATYAAPNAVFGCGRTPPHDHQNSQAAYSFGLSLFHFANNDDDRNASRCAAS